jgi:carboxyl-terminal processing protease
MGEFDLLPADLDEYVAKRVKGAKALILDLRGNPGGYVDTLERLTSHFFDREIQIAELRGRRKMKPMVARKRRGKPFGGRLIVLVDSDSASASEIFAHLMQLEKRGRVIGDRSAGAVMQSESMTGKLSAGADSVIVFTLSITNADVIMADDKSLEHVGVTPDELLLPTAQDYAAGRDPVLMRAIELAGGKVSPEGSGKLFPMLWGR